MMKDGQLPNLAKLRDAGGFSQLGTSIPPQSPVAWANFINGAGPGSHGIFDFIHRHPARAVRAVLLRRRDAARRGRLGDRRPQAAARLLAVQPQAAETVLRRRACRSGTTSTRPACRRRSTTCRRTIRPARRSTATTAASAAWARPTCSAATARISTSPRTCPPRASRRGRQALAAVVRERDGQGAARRPGEQPAQAAEADHGRVPRPPRPRRRTRR